MQDQDREIHDVLVLGAGIVGVSTALHLQMRGRRVCLVDQDDPGQGTSFGNAGLIERASVVPYSFPRSWRQVFSYLGNRHSALRFEWRALPGLAPWLWRYWRESGPDRLQAASRDMLPLVERCVAEHEPFVKAAGLRSLIRESGWIDMYRDSQAFESAASAAALLSQQHGLRVDVLGADALRAREPGFLPQAEVAGGIHWLDPWSVQSPGDLVAGYARLFGERGGQLLRAKVRALRPDAGRWLVEKQGQGGLAAREVVLALGPDTLSLCESLGYRLPLVHKRGYHLHFRPERGEAVPLVPLCDSEAGFVLASMKDGVRLTTGVSLAALSSPPDSSQVRAAEQVARRFWPLGRVVEAEPWMGRRPCLPDMRPVIGPAPRHRGLWFNTGHAHHGLTLGPVSGRLLAEMMTGETPVVDPAPYAVSRFDG